VADEGRDRRDGPAGQIRPGALSQLLAELAQPPDREARVEPGETIAPGSEVGRFQLVREIGRGGFGVVYEARDRELGRAVAFKAIRAGKGSPALREERLLREAEAAARLSHPNLVTLHDVGHGPAGPFLVLELLQGRTLADRLDQGPIPLAEALEVAVQVARGLAYAHAHGVFHRDLKPANVFLCDGGLVKILDFGLAHAFGQPRVDGGTPAYMAPEQWRSAPEDERTDVFALGVMLYRMLAGEVPFPGDRSGKALLSSRPVPALDVPEAPALGALATRMLGRDPVDRPRDGAEVLASLEAIQEQLRAANPSRQPSSSTGPTARLRRAHAWLRPAAWLLLVVAMTAAGTAWYLSSRPEGLDRPVVAIADVENATGDPELDGLSGLIATGLEQSRRIGVLHRGRMLEAARLTGHRGSERIDEQMGVEVGRSIGATALLLSTVRRLGSTWVVEVRAVDPRRGTHLFTLREQAQSKEGILPLVDRVTEQVRRELREPAAEVAGRRARLEELVTGNLDAYRHYFLARTHLDRFRLPEAIAELDRALAIDPRFALAHYQLARMGRSGEISEATRRGHEAKALRLADRLPPRERGILLATSAAAAGRLDEAEATWRDLAGDFPDDPDVLFGAGDLLLARENAAEGAPYLLLAVELQPSNEVFHQALSRALGFLGRTGELQAAARRARAAAPGPETDLFLAEAALWNGDLATAEEAARQALVHGERQANDTLLRVGMRADDAGIQREGAAASSLREAAVALHRGRIGDFRPSIDLTVDLPPAWDAQVALEKLLLQVGAGNRDQIDTATGRLAETGLTATGAAAAAVAWAGAAVAAERLAALLPPSSPDAALHRAVAQRVEGSAAAALPALRVLSRTHASGSTYLDSFFLGEAALEAGRPDEAAEALRRFQRMSLPSSVLAWAYPRSLLLLARAEEAAGRLPEARAAAERVARTWRDADPDFPPLVELAALRSRLGP
jgi:tetratricopeptide (TPR) repeat protein